MRVFIITLLIFATACGDRQNRDRTAIGNTFKESADAAIFSEKDNNIVVGCDSIYDKKGYKVFLTPIRDADEGENSKWYLFKFARKDSTGDVEIYKDTIESSVAQVSFIDFNSDGIKDILIQNISDVRSNWTYNLFLVDASLYTLTHIRGFEEIKNPTYLPTEGIVTNYVSSGTNWTSFYKILDDTVTDFGIVIEDDLNDDSSYKRNYDKALLSIKRRKKNDP